MRRVLDRLWRRSTRPFASNPRGATATPTPTEILTLCRRLLRHSLDDDSIQRELSDYAAHSEGMDYQEIWRRRLKLITRVIEEGEIQLPRVLAEVARRIAEHDDNMQTAGYVGLNKKLQLPRVAAINVHRGLVADVVIGICTPGTGVVLELGSGWGEYLANVWLAGGPREARYYACEPSEYGRKCAVVLGALDRSFQISTAWIDYRAPQFDFLPRQNSLVAYSVHSIEQVEQLPSDLIHRLCWLAERVSVAHIEPIGWQMKHASPNFFGLAYNPASVVVWHKR